LGSSLPPLSMSGSPSKPPGMHLGKLGTFPQALPAWHPVQALPSKPLTCPASVLAWFQARRARLCPQGPVLGPLPRDTLSKSTPSSKLQSTAWKQVRTGNRLPSVGCNQGGQAWRACYGSAVGGSEMHCFPSVHPQTSPQASGASSLVHLAAASVQPSSGGCKLQAQLNMCGGSAAVSMQGFASLAQSR
jgi:hypothetical protein